MTVTCKLGFARRQARGISRSSADVKSSASHDKLIQSRGIRRCGNLSPSLPAGSSMLVYIIRRGLQALLVLLVMSVLVFLGVYAIGNPVDILINPQADQADRERAIATLGLDQPLWVQYWKFLAGAIHGDLGKSFVHGTSALGMILERMPATLELAIVAMLIAIVLGIPLGLWAGLKPNSAAGRTIMAGSILGFSLPTFWVGLMLIMVFSVMLGWLPSGGRGPTTSLFGIQVSFLSL